MTCKLTELTCKEVICICDGRRLGFVSDAIVQIPEGNIVSLIVPAACRFSQLGRRDDYIIPWECVCKIGPDILLVDIKPDQCRAPRPRLGFLL